MNQEIIIGDYDKTQSNIEEAKKEHYFEKLWNDEDFKKLVE